MSLVEITKEKQSKDISELLQEIISMVNFFTNIDIDRCAEPGCNVFSINNRGPNGNHYIEFNGKIFSCEINYQCDSEIYCKNHMNGKLFISGDKICCKNCIN